MTIVSYTSDAIDKNEHRFVVLINLSFFLSLTEHTLSSRSDQYVHFTVEGTDEMEHCLAILINVLMQPTRMNTVLSF